MCKHAVLVLSVLLALTLAVEAQTPSGGKIKVTAEQANLREKPDIGSSIVQQIPEGTVLEADKKDGEWYFVRYMLEDGGVIGGWIHESLVQVVEEVRPPREAVTKPDEAAPPRERTRRPVRLPRIKAPEFRTGSLPLEFSVSAGAAMLEPPDLNGGTRGYVRWRGAALGAQATEGPQVLRFAALAGFELTYRFSARLAIGLGADYLRGATGDETVIAGELLDETVRTKPSVRGVPVKIVARYYPGAGFYVRSALGLYAVKAGYLFRIEDAGGWEQHKGSVTDTGLGLEAAFGGEWTIAPRTILFAEAGLRAAGFNGLTGHDVFTDSDGLTLTEVGRLYAFGVTGADANVYRLIAVRASVPSEEGVVDPRLARINLSGAAIRAGVRYRF